MQHPFLFCIVHLAFLLLLLMTSVASGLSIAAQLAIGAVAQGLFVLLII